MTINFYSPKAYEYLRSTFKHHLPAARTLRSWYSSIDCSPGFTASAFDALREKVEKYKANGKELKVGLIFDEMRIRQHSQWDHSKKEFLGHDTAGNKSANISSGKEICTPLSTQVLVLMISGIEVEFKITIAYFLNSNLSGEEQAALLDEALLRLKSVGIKIVSFTFDGAPKNIKSVKLLGADFKNNKPYFQNAYDGNSIIYVILDPPHMLKLARNCLGNKGILYDEKNEEIRWKLIRDLVEIQISRNINLGNKLTMNHIEFESNAMNVRIAAETMSKSTANSIEYLDIEMKNENFSNSIPTSKYCRTIDNLFDTMNTKKNHCKGGFKRPFSEETIEEFTTYYNQTKEYIKGIKIMKEDKLVSVLQSNSFTPFFGFMHNMTSFTGIYNDYVKNYSAEFYPFRVSQDLLESYFGCVRRMGSTNDNPSAQQFAGAYRKLLLQNEVTSSQKSNCENDLTKILTVSSGKKVTPTAINPEELRMLQGYDFENPVDDDEYSGEIDLLVGEEKEPTETLRVNSLAYLSGVIETQVIQKISRRTKNACQKCIDVFIENEISDDSFVVFMSQRSNKIMQPCKSTLKILRTVEFFLEKYHHSESVSFNAVVTHIVNNIEMSQLYVGSDFNEDHDHNHKNDLVKQIIQKYLDHKSHIFSQKITRLSQQKLIRHDRLKRVHQLGQ